VALNQRQRVEVIQKSSGHPLVVMVLLVSYQEHGCQEVSGLLDEVVVAAPRISVGNQEGVPPVG
jgi:hypothetical protein